MEDSRRDDIVDDLLSLRPKGLPSENAEYEEYTEFCHQAYKYKKRVRCSHPHWGYDVDTLFGLGFETRSEVGDYVAKRFYEKETYQLKKGQKSGASRKINRLWNRIMAAVEEVQTEGRPGIYALSKRWGGGILATVWAQDHDEAITMGKMFYGHVLPEGEGIRTKFKRIGQAEEVIAVNVEAVEDLRRTMEANRSRIERLQNEIVQYEARIEAIQMMQSHLLNVNSRAEESQ